MARKGYKATTFTLPDGTRKYVYAKTQEELDEKVFHLKLQVKAGVDLKDRTTLGELIKLWFETEVVPGVKENTAAIIRSNINTHLLPLCSGYVAKDVTPSQVKLWLNETGKLNRCAAKSCFRALKGAFQIAEENGLLLRSPVLSRYKSGGRPGEKRKALTPVEEQQLLSVLAGTPAHLFVWFALATGARRGEILGLMWDKVDLERAEVHLERNLVFLDRSRTELRDYMKTEAGTRTVPLPPDLCAALKEEKRRAKSVFLFTRRDGRLYNADSFGSFWDIVYRRFGPDARQTSRIKGIVTETKATPHVLRHTYATRCFEAGMDIKEVQHLMGHANSSITLDIYTHYCQDSRQEDTFNKARAARSCTTSVPQVYHEAASGGAI